MRLLRNAGFSLVELLVLLAILVILLSIFIPFLARARETDRRVRCTDNLRVIQQAIKAYATANGNNLPRVTYEPSRGPTGYVAYTGADSPDPFARGSNVRPNDVTASLWLLVRAGLAPASRFVCPSTGDWVSPGAGTQSSNFAGARNLSYSYASPFSAAPAYRLNADLLKFDFAVLADKNPGTGGGDQATGPAYDAGPFALAKANSNNHGEAGQNVLYADGHVEFQTSPFAGTIITGNGSTPFNPTYRDNIYTPCGASRQANGSDATAINNGPNDSSDTHLLPTDDTNGV
jgi:prepilin-type processing-associated H-X9-DG protein